MDKETVVLFGAGQLGQRTAERIRDRYHVVFADNHKAGEMVNHTEVLSPQKAIDLYGDTAPFVVTIYNGHEVREQLMAAGVSNVRHFRSFYEENADMCLPYACLQGDTSIRNDDDCKVWAIRDMLADPESRQVLMDTWNWLTTTGPVGYYHYNTVFAHDDPNDIYFPDFIKPLSDEFFIDCGAYDGDTVRSFLKHRHDPQDSFILAVEPDSCNFFKLADYVRNAKINSGFRGMGAIVGSSCGTVGFAETATASSHIAHQMPQKRCVTIDSLAEQFKRIPTYIKMDIEGAEIGALHGARGTITDHAPVLAVCLYHKRSDLWEIPQLIHSMNPRYNLFMRAYAEDCWERVLYAVPDDRLVQV